MAKVGIVTFHNAHNFGAVLQCLALKTVLMDLGHQVKVIDHRNPEIEKAYALKQSPSRGHNLMWRLKSKVARTLSYLRRRSRYKKYTSFILDYLLDDSVESSTGQYDCIVWGSDQIWRWELTKDDLFFWGECMDKNVRKISYAASAGKIDAHFDRNLKYLAAFDALSVRETELRDHLSNVGIKSDVSLDPTLLLSKVEWQNILPIKYNEEQDYVLVYSMRNREKVRKLAFEIAEKEDCKVIEIFNSFISYREILEKYSSAGPLDFISLIYNAKFVVTDSFHGTVFSIIFNKQFITVRLNDGQDNRAAGLLSSLDIGNRLREDISNYQQTIDYNEVNKKLDKLKYSSINYLKKNVFGN